MFKIKMEDKESQSPNAPKLSFRRIRLRVQKKRTRKSSDDDIKEISDGVNKLTLESKIKIPTRKLNKRQKTSKSSSSDFMSKYNILTKEDKSKIKREVEKLKNKYEKCISYRFNQKFPIQSDDDFDKKYVAIVPIIPDSNIAKHSPSEIDIEKVKMNADIVNRNDINSNPLFKLYMLFTSVLTDRFGSIVFYPEEKFSEFLNKDTDSKSIDADEDGVETENQWENMDSETILKLFKNVFNVVSKKTKKIIKTKYIQYSPNLGVFLVILKGKQYKLKNAKFGDKHYPWRWDHNWDHYNNWMPDYENKIFRRDCSPYLCALTSDKYLSVTDNEVKYRFDDDTPTQPRKRLFHKMTWRFIYEELAKC